MANTFQVKIVANVTGSSRRCGLVIHEENGPNFYKNNSGTVTERNEILIEILISHLPCALNFFFCKLRMSPVNHL